MEDRVDSSHPDALSHSLGFFEPTLRAGTTLTPRSTTRRHRSRTSRKERPSSVWSFRPRITAQSRRRATRKRLSSRDSKNSASGDHRRTHRSSQRSWTASTPGSRALRSSQRGEPSALLGSSSSTSLTTSTTTSPHGWSRTSTGSLQATRRWCRISMRSTTGTVSRGLSLWFRRRPSKGSIPRQ